MRRDDDISVKLDWTTILLFMALVTLGWLNIFAAIYDETANQTIWDLSLSSGRQLMFIAAAAVIVLMIIIIDMRFYETFAYLFYGLILVLLFLIPFIGKEVGGNKAWIGIGSFGVQPSEFAKFITALAVAKFIGSVGFRMDNLRNQAILFALIGVPIILIQLQKDTGTALVFTSFVLVFYREGMSPFLLIVGVCAATIFVLTLLVPNPVYLHAAVAILLILLISFGKKKLKRIAILVIGALLISGVIVSVDYVVNNVLKPHQQNRVKVLVNPNIDPLGVGWNVTQSKIAIGSGGFKGKGFLKGTQTKFDFVPKQSTDFIFCTIGEEFGWIGSLVVIGLFVALLLRVIFLSERQRSRFARAYGYSVACILFFHFAINIGMTVGLFPVIGIPLPFFSYGGSSLWGFTILLFVLLKLDAHRSQVLQRI
ncbi:MAG: rod shape-determining protein RodA [Cytophagales bacterium]|nr:rod shape-determining protein RodA [Cytophagales bacterium]MCA6389111.1 rod shape-determining protein RodA [Cytophagales bacterium]MCA6393506.1 rod shape-determining protein RodA [Cytophagales bacterium]MCA6394126.1 rod shape-determining protein RodA [Cytophagales bacterium]MCA6399596.1 rod shape-determining protein RodA [Cytophagales bacterium]